MKKLTAGIFAGILTIVTVNANANIASQGYVDQEVAKKQPMATADMAVANKDGTWQALSAGENIDITGGVISTTGLQGTLTGEGAITVADNKVSVATGSATDLGVVKQGTNVTIDATGAVNVATASDTTAGVTKLYDAKGTATDGTMTQKAIGEQIADAVTAGTSFGVEGANKAVITDAAGDLATGEITSAMIADGTVVAVDIAADAIETAKIKDKNVTKAKLEDSVQTSLGLADTALQLDDVNFLARATTLPEECSDATNYCVLTFNGTSGYYWEVIKRATGETGGKPAGN